MPLGFLSLPTFQSLGGHIIDKNCSRELDFLFWFINGAIGTIIVIGNSLTCAAFLRFEYLRRSYMNLFLLSLAICDALMAVLVTPGVCCILYRLCILFEQTLLAL